MTKITLTLAAALLAGTTLTSAASAGGVRVGFGFPLGSFIAHSAQSSMDDGYNRRYERRRRAYRTEPAPVRKAKPVSRIANAKPVAKPAVKPAVKPIITTAKLGDRLASDPATTTEIAKTSDATTGSAAPTSTPASASTTSTVAAAETPKTDKVATVDKTQTEEKSRAEKTVPEKQICRRYSAAIAGLVDVPCNE